MMLIEKLQRLARKTYECFTEQDSSDLKLAANLFDACVEVRDYLNSASMKWVSIQTLSNVNFIDFISIEINE